MLTTAHVTRPRLCGVRQTTRDRSLHRAQPAAASAAGGRGLAFDVRCAVAPPSAESCLPAPWAPHGAHRAGAPPPPICAFARLCVCFAKMSRRRRSAGRRSRDEAVRCASARAATVPTHPSIARAASSRRASSAALPGPVTHADARLVVRAEELEQPRERSGRLRRLRVRERLAGLRACGCTALHATIVATRGDARRSAMQQCGAAVQL